MISFTVIITELSITMTQVFLHNFTFIKMLFTFKS